MKKSFGKLNFDKSGKVHFHNSDGRFCGSRKMARQISFDTNKITCEKCSGNIGLTITEQGRQALRDLGYAV